MVETPRQIHLAVLLGNGVHVGGWRLPEALYDPDNFALQLRLAKMAEDAKFDMVFLADTLATSTASPPVALTRLDPMTIMAALASTTTHIGLAATATTTYSQPYLLARQFASIDHISGGRAAWNIVTGLNPEAAQNFSLTAYPDKEQRYGMAAEFVEICKGLWDSWEDDAFIKDKERGIPADFSKFHAVNYKGPHYQVKGPLNLRRPPQGYPVIVQAGASNTGVDFAAKYAEIVFTVQEDMATTKAFGERVRALAKEAGRDPNSIKIVPGICPIIAESVEASKAMLARMASFAEPVAAMKMLSQRLDLPEVEKMPLDGPVPDIPLEKRRGHAITLLGIAKKYDFNLRQLRDYASAANGHRLIFGNPQQIADDLEEWFVSGAADGFILHLPFVMGPMEDFANKVVPILQEKGIFRKDYSGTTLRDHLGLKRPPHPATLARNGARAAE